MTGGEEKLCSSVSDSVDHTINDHQASRLKAAMREKSEERVYSGLSTEENRREQS